MEKLKHIASDPGYTQPSRSKLTLRVLQLLDLSRRFKCLGESIHGGFQKGSPRIGKIEDIRLF
ncbi:hypothetical protein F441_02283 [Phytophthora nicotianae CJ01A1]|uniref:Uncharacterized protein n=4 Tax=Phytophthora nicotianae TaxID=4792 RepID=W2QPM2_PHYN3|nr:hypothetical protein PPTG_07139 [Phytophthora nicotianae INRA-310]ETK94798.1 hypothetical protein L915_02211 [Phytophthora nicotianae]ETO83710.1 hypothetical protein F444_02307 [Phytophthora nicotianae P1976]ETP24769.1 hypothetical protein F441_02283 [Phytophthora nicotianae CJ01A1]ETL48193.1 hypothetical protein L916_02172 [Phytophthora nicotianae]ETM01283.1 hypothetical protein L917_02108 [Phytophthora nicotianae]